MTPYQIVVPFLACVAVAYAWSLAARKKKTVWEAMLWSIFWVCIGLIALFPNSLAYLTVATGIKDQANAVLVTCIGILFFFMFYVVIRLEELEQRQTKLIRTVAMRDAGVKDEYEV